MSLLPIAAISWSGQVLSRSFSRVRSPGSSTDAVVLRSQTALTGPYRPRTIRQREQGRPAGTGETYCVLSGPCFVFRASRPALVRPERERQRERRPGRRGGGACGPAGRLETVQRVPHHTTPAARRPPERPPEERSRQARVTAGSRCADAGREPLRKTRADHLGVNESHGSQYWSLVQLTGLLRSYEVGAGRRGCCTCLLYRAKTMPRLIMPGRVAPSTLVNGERPRCSCWSARR